MPRRKTFAQTWWGQAWVDALERIDRDTNRLPRGRTYARNGSVLRVDISGRQVSALVQGRRWDPYEISIRLKAYTKSQRRDWEALLDEHPAVRAQLELGVLAEEILSLAELRELPLLPRSWNDISASCSCPDWANPCKHLAAVFYLMAAEIDKNPMQLLQLRGVDVESAQPTLEAMRSLRRRFVQPDAATPQPGRRERPPLTLDNSSGRDRLGLLPDTPVFDSTGLLKKELVKAYEQVAETAAAIQIKDLERVDRYQDYRLLFVPDPDSLMEHYEIRSVPDAAQLPVDWDTRVPSDPVRLCPAAAGATLMWFLSRPLLTAESGFPPGAVFLSEAAAVSLLLAEHSMLTPEVTADAEGNFFINHVPTFFTEEARNLQVYLESVYPADFIQSDLDQNVLEPADGVREVLTVFLNQLVYVSAPFPGKTSLSQPFFTDEVYWVDSFTERNTALAIRNWLSSAHLPQDICVPVLQLTPTEGDSFRMTLGILPKGERAGTMVALSEVMSGQGEFAGSPMAAVKRDLVRQLTIAQLHFPALQLFVEGAGALTLDGVQAAELLLGSQQTLQMLGFRMLLPKELVKLARPKAALHGSGSGSHGGGAGLDELIRFSWRASVGDSIIDESEFRALARDAGKVVRFRGQFVYLDPEETAAILRRLQESSVQLKDTEALRAAVVGDVDGTPISLDGRAQQVLEDLVSVDQVSVPEGLQAELRPYQLDGFRWAHSRLKHGIGCCLADDMGLGKTIQAIAVMLQRQKEGLADEPVLVICPTTLMANWEKEIQRFAPSLQSLVYHGQGRRLTVSGVDVVITTYGLARHEQARLQRRTWSLLVLDEAQNIKNPETKQTRAITGLKASGTLALTGTPVENRLRELWSIFQILLPGYLGSQKGFNRSYALPIEKYGQPEPARRLQKAVSPFVLRRMKTDKTIIQDLPDKIVEDEYCVLTKEQAVLYQAVVDDVMAKLDKAEGIERRGLVLQLLTWLKQICNHPHQYTESGELRAADSGKAVRTLEIVGGFLNQGEKVLVFTQYRQMVHLLRRLLQEELACDSLVFHGGLSAAQRSEVIESFQESGRHSVLIISLKAGGTGLNLTQATGVIHYDLWWNPAVENQATDRTYRIGQENPVTVKRLISTGTFEERINAMIQSKQKVADLILRPESALTEWSNQQLAEFFRLGER